VVHHGEQRQVTPVGDGGKELLELGLGEVARKALCGEWQRILVRFEAGLIAPYSGKAKSEVKSPRARPNAAVFAIAGSGLAAANGSGGRRP
jgi:hypothetical protein